MKAREFDQVFAQIRKSNLIKRARRAERVPFTKGGYRRPRWGGSITK